MDIFNIKDMKGGWFIGNFEPSVYKTEEFEVAYARHHKGQKWDTHYHKKSTEINLADPEFLEDCELIVVKTASVIGDKYAVVQKES